MSRRRSATMPVRSAAPRPSRREAAISAFAWLALFAFLARDWITVAAHSSPTGNPEMDAPYVTWTLWWVAKSLSSNPLGIYDAPIFHPSPDMLTAHEHFLSSQVVFLPVWAATGNPVLAANAVSLLSYPLAGFAMERLLRALGLGRAASFLGGLAFALGPWRIPGSNQLPQMLAFFLPALVLALIRARQQPSARRFACFGLLLLLALFSSYYMALMSVLVVAAWVLLDVARDRRGSVRFVATVAATGLACSLLLALFSIPWTRARAAPPVLPLPVSMKDLWRPLWQPSDDFVEPLLALAGTAALISPRRRFPAATGLAIALGASALILALSRFGMPQPILPVFGFFRTYVRLQIVTSFGVAILAGCALQIVADRWHGRAGAVVAATAGLALVATLGSRISHPGTGDAIWWKPGRPWHRQHPGAAAARTLERVGQIARANGAGPLVEVGVPQWDTMVDATWHDLPLVGGYTTLWPPQYFGVLSRLGPASGLDELVDVSHLRWVLFPPPSRWSEPIDRDALLRDLLALPHTKRFDVDDYVLVRLDRTPAHPDWYETLAAGRPLSDLPPDDAESISRLKAPETMGTVGTAAPAPPMHAKPRLGDTPRRNPAPSDVVAPRSR